ncbi:response regulator transcription factor [Pontibacter harenae]|uniref:response regulator transcription factor n=1 Tax=Pontibacter harenae TaxID=2894083 RepID=UPI001E52F0C4|nr:LuxR C-terminal-related transcriptional regulator [Pontibacter harenae]MCC9168349.1 LuxR C-terminal-related transcriptional regulator [Pontibacter harenae]
MGHNEKPLSRRQLEILSLLEGGLNCRQISVQLGLREAIVEAHYHMMLRKLNLNDSYQLISWAYREGVLV